MKKNDILLMAFAILFSGLFYLQVPGINYLLFTLLLSATILLTHPEKRKDRRWWYYCAGANLCGAAVFAVNSDLSVFACIVSVLVLCGKSASPGNSVIACFLLSLYSLVTSFIQRMIELKRPAEDSASGNQQLTVSIVIACVAIVVFFFLYRAANPLFDDFARTISLNWLSFGWLNFTLLSVAIIYGLVRSRRLDWIVQTDLRISKNIAGTATENAGTAKSGATAVLVLFAVLNLMLLITNGLDIASIYITRQLPANITLSDFVHDAVAGIVVSVVIAVSLIAWFFRGGLNFEQAGRPVKRMVYAWIAQSMLVVLNAMMRNYWYIQQYQLTYLRICVFVFLALCGMGLALTYIKVAHKKSAWSLLAGNVNVWLAVLLLASPVNWDRVITRYNIQHSSKARQLDMAYLFSLSDANLPDLVQLAGSSQLSQQDRQELEQKLLASQRRDRFRQWPSFNLRALANAEARQLLRQHKINAALNR